MLRLLKGSLLLFILIAVIETAAADELIDYMRSGTGTNAAYSGQTMVCQGFAYGYLPDTHNALHNITILSWNIKRAAGPVGRTDFRIFNATAAGGPDKIQMSKEVDISLDTSYRWENITLDNQFQAINKTLYFMCIYNNQSTNYIHVANNGSDPYKAGTEWVNTGSWTNNSASDDDFSIYGFEIVVDTSNPTVAIKTPLNNTQWINDDVIKIVTNFSDDYLLASFNISILDPQNGVNRTIYGVTTAQSVENTTYVTLPLEGLWKIRAEARDSHGKYGEKVHTVNITSRARKDSEVLRDTKDLTNSIFGVIDMIPVIMLYALFMLTGYWMILTGNTVSGWLIFAISLGFDFLLSGLLYAKYVADAAIGTFKGSMIVIFLFFLFVWLIAKLSSFLLLQQRVKLK